jgi:diguanylate cyclase (GGDEF)-like protein
VIEQTTQDQAMSVTAPRAREGVSVGVVLCDPAGHAIHVDDAAAVLIGRDPTAGATERLRAWQRLESLLLDDQGAPLDPELFPVRLAAASGRAVHDVIVLLPGVDGSPARRLQITAEPLRSAPNAPPSGIVVVLIEVDAESSSARPAGASADAPAGRAELESHLVRLLGAAKRENRGFATLALGIDRFKTVQDSLGHGATEQLEWQVAGRLQRDLRDDDFVARTGEGDFLLLLAGTSSSSDVARAVERIRAAFDRRWETDGREIFLTPSIGIAIFPSDGAGGEELVRNAAKAMRRAQSAGGNTWQFFHEEIDPATSERLGLESALHRALELDHFILDFQPQIDSYSGGVVGVEALLRWKDPERGIVPPNQFIPLAEETGLMLPIGAWVLEAACRQAILWNPGITDSDGGVRMAVNISPRQFEQQDIVGLVRKTLSDTGLAPHLLEIEITESMAIQDPEHTIALLNGLKQLGVRVALDDFGTGYSSLSHLARLPIDTVKIDRSFVMNLEEAHEHVVIATSVIALGHRLGLTVIAEGVETHEQAAFLGAESCDVLQGFLFSKPVSPEKCADLLGGEAAFAAMLEEAAGRLADLMGKGGFGAR